MKSKLKFAIGLGVGVGSGTALLEFISHGLSDVDWMNAIYLTFFIFLVTLLVPRKWLGLDKPNSNEAPKAKPGDSAPEVK